VNGFIGPFVAAQGELSNAGIARSGKYLFGYSGGRLQSFDLSDPKKPVFLFATEGIGFNSPRSQIFISGVTLFSPGIGGAGAWDISDPKKLRSASGLGCGRSGNDAVAYKGGLLFTSGSGGIAIFQAQ
jgi:hypothetical protein